MSVLVRALVRSRSLPLAVGLAAVVVTGVYAQRGAAFVASLGVVGLLGAPIVAWVTARAAVLVDGTVADLLAVERPAGPRALRAAGVGAGFALLFAVAGLAFPLAVDAFREHLTAGQVALGAVVEAAALLGGVALGVLAAPPVVRRAGTGALVIALAWIASIAATAGADGVARVPLVVIAPWTALAEPHAAGARLGPAPALGATLASALALVLALVVARRVERAR